MHFSCLCKTLTNVKTAFIPLKATVRLSASIPTNHCLPACSLYRDLNCLPRCMEAAFPQKGLRQAELGQKQIQERVSLQYLSMGHCYNRS
uniref:Uncharacterized protein n=1 Tax=Anguilla anguilla TaxID=7936 RepID=A0A0E9PJ17_ANGAN